MAHAAAHAGAHADAAAELRPATGSFVRWTAGYVLAVIAGAFWTDSGWVRVGLIVLGTAGLATMLLSALGWMASIRIEGDEIQIDGGPLGRRYSRHDIKEFDVVRSPAPGANFVLVRPREGANEGHALSRWSGAPILCSYLPLNADELARFLEDWLHRRHGARIPDPLTFREADGRILTPAWFAFIVICVSGVVILTAVISERVAPHADQTTANVWALISLVTGLVLGLGSWWFAAGREAVSRRQSRH